MSHLYQKASLLDKSFSLEYLLLIMMRYCFISSVQATSLYSIFTAIQFAYVNIFSHLNSLRYQRFGCERCRCSCCCCSCCYYYFLLLSLNVHCCCCCGGNGGCVLFLFLFCFCFVFVLAFSCCSLFCLL